MSLAPGTRIGPYAITRCSAPAAWERCIAATDTKLKRQVAITILPESFVGDPDRLARFHREAEGLASLNHFHIAAIYGREDSGRTAALVMELVEGPTLAERLPGRRRSRTRSQWRGRSRSTSASRAR